MSWHGYSLHRRRIETLQQLLLHSLTGAHTQRALANLGRLARAVLRIERPFEHLDDLELTSLNRRVGANEGISTKGATDNQKSV